MNGDEEQVRASSGWFRSLRMVAWGFFGVRKRSEMDKDVRIHPLQIVLTALVVVLVLVVALIALVHWVVS